MLHRQRLGRLSTVTSPRYRHGYSRCRLIIAILSEKGRWDPTIHSCDIHIGTETPYETAFFVRDWFCARRWLWWIS